MEIGEFIEQDILVFLDKRTEKSTDTKKSPEVSSVFLSRDYEEEMFKALDHNDLVEAKHVLHDLKQKFDECPHGTPDKEQLKYLLMDLYEKFKDHLDTINTFEKMDSDLDALRKKPTGVLSKKEVEPPHKTLAGDEPAPPVPLPSMRSDVSGIDKPLAPQELPPIMHHPKHEEKIEDHKISKKPVRPTEVAEHKPPKPDYSVESAPKLVKNVPEHPKSVPPEHKIVIPDELPPLPPEPKAKPAPHFVPVVHSKPTEVVEHEPLRKIIRHEEKPVPPKQKPAPPKPRMHVRPKLHAKPSVPKEEHVFRDHPNFKPKEVSTEERAIKSAERTLDQVEEKIATNNPRQSALLYKQARRELLSLKSVPAWLVLRCTNIFKRIKKLAKEHKDKNIHEVVDLDHHLILRLEQEKHKLDAQLHKNDIANAMRTYKAMRIVAQQITDKMKAESAAKKLIRIYEIINQVRQHAAHNDSSLVRSVP